MSTIKKPTNKAKVLKVASRIKSGPSAVKKIGGSQLRGFMDFIRTQGVVGLAIGLVLGGSVSVMVKSLVDNVVMPPLGMVMGSAEGLKGLAWTIGKTSSGQPTILHYGIFLNDLVNFIIIAAVIYFIVTLLRFDRIDKKKS